MTKLVDIPLDEITIREDRAREDFGDIEGLTESILKHGVLQPITVDQDYGLLAGERRYRAAKMAELDTIPAVVRTVTGDLDRYEVELVENVHRKDLEWLERARLERRILEIKGSYRKAADVVDSGPGFVHRHVQLAEAADVIPEIAQCKTEADAWKVLQKVKETMVIKELANRVAQAEEEPDEYTPLEISILRKAQDNYVIGDAIEGLRECGSMIFGMAEVDPPYGIRLDRLKRGSEDQHHNVKRYTEVHEDDYPEFVEAVTEEVFRVLVPNTFCIWWFGPTYYTLTHDLLQKAGFIVSDIPAIWYKGAQGQTQQPNVHLANCYEMFWVARKGRPMLTKPGRSNVFAYSPVPSHAKIHATERPVELIEDIIDTFSYPGQSIVSPFLGSGATLRACYNKRVAAVGWDLEQDVKNKFILKVQDDWEGRESYEVEVPHAE
jgi:ParB/RepB/Spo0J family partition protein